MNRNDVLGLEFDWFAVDQDDHIGHFASAGYGIIPQVVFDDAAAHEDLLIYFHAQPVQTDAELMVAPVGTLDDWLIRARQGFFSYDFSHWDEYQIIARPVRPMILRDLPSPIQQIIQHIRFIDICFVTAPTIMAKQVPT